MDCLYLSKFGSLKRQGTDKEHLAYTKTQNKPITASYMQMKN